MTDEDVQRRLAKLRKELGRRGYGSAQYIQQISQMTDLIMEWMQDNGDEGVVFLLELPPDVAVIASLDSIIDSDILATSPAARRLIKHPTDAWPAWRCPTWLMLCSALSIARQARSTRSRGES